MSNRFLIMVGTVSGLVMVVCLLLFPAVVWGSGDTSASLRIIQMAVGGFLLTFTWFGFGFAAMLFLKLNDRIDVAEQTCRVVSLVGYKLAAFFFLALLIAGSGERSWGFGFWFSFIASIVGAFAVYLTFNPKLAQKIADATKSDEEEASSDESDGGGDDGDDASKENGSE